MIRLKELIVQQRLAFEYSQLLIDFEQPVIRFAPRKVKLRLAELGKKKPAPPVIKRWPRR